MMKPLSEVTGAGWKCQHDYFSYQALVLALTEFAVPKVSAAGMAGTRFLLLGKVATKLAAKEGFIGKVFKKIKPKAGWREEFKLEKNIIHVIYFQVRALPVHLASTSQTPPSLTPQRIPSPSSTSRRCCGSCSPSSPSAPSSARSSSSSTTSGRCARAPATTITTASAASTATAATIPTSTTTSSL